MSAQFLHELADFKDLIEIVAKSENIKDPALVEKDYWLMHVLSGLQQLQFKFHLKGGTSLSKGYGCIHRFSEDIDLKIEPDEKQTRFKVYTTKNQDDKHHRESRARYFDWIRDQIDGRIPGILEVKRDHTFDDVSKMRNGGVRLFYSSHFLSTPGLKDGILLELGFDRTAPNQPCMITSWVYERASTAPGISIVDNRAVDVPCYEPKYTFVEKLQAVVRKYRLYKDGKEGANLPVNFIRHYYDLCQLINRDDVKAFIGTPEYENFKVERFGRDDTRVRNSGAFNLSPEDRAIFEKAYERSKSLYFKGRPSLQEILERMAEYLDRL
jgi:hypothetical protein